MALHEATIKPGKPFVIGATGMADILQCLRVIVGTMVYSVPLDRGFANNGKLIDSPAPYGADLRLAELAEAITKYEPRVKVRNLALSAQGTAEDLMDGRIFPVVTFELAEGVEL